MQVLTEPIVSHLSKTEDIVFVNDTLQLTNRFLSGEKIDPDLLYSRLENLDEQDILTYFELDSLTDSAIWTCIADAVAYICRLSYSESGEQYMPETIEAVDELTIDEFFTQYKQYLKKTEMLSDLKTYLANDKRVHLDSEAVQSKYDFLLS